MVLLQPGLFAIRQIDLDTLKQQQEFKFTVNSTKYPEKIATEDIILWTFPINDDFLVAANGPEGYKLMKYEIQHKKDEL